MSLTHKEVESLCDKFMYQAGWWRSGRAQISHNPKVIADRIYFKKGKIPLMFEIKPENALNEEIKTGIGQLSCGLPFKVKPYLVMSASKIEPFQPIYSQLPWLGVLTYSDGKLSQQQKSQGTNGQILVPISPLAIPGSRELIAQTIKTLKGHYSTEELVAILSNQLPGYQFFSRYVGSVLVRLGYKKKRKEGVNGFLINVDSNFTPIKGKKGSSGALYLQGGHPQWSVPTVPSVPDSIKARICPKCGGSLRVRKRGKALFLGCSNYPECHFSCGFDISPVSRDITIEKRAEYHENTTGTKAPEEV